MKRSDLIRNVVDEYARPEPVAGPRPRPGLSTLELAGHTLVHETKAGNVRPGGVLKMVASLPVQDRDAVILGTREFDHQVELGRHGNPARVAADLGVDLELAHTLRDGIEADYVAAALQERRSDASLPLPEITRADQIEAALAAHDYPTQE